MGRAAPTRSLRFSADLVQAAWVVLLLGAVLAATEPNADLGAQACSMQPGTIPALHPGILEQLKLCPALTTAQHDAVNAVLLGGGTAYGHPSSWDAQMLQRLGPLALALNQTTLSLVNKAARDAFARSIAATYSSQGRAQREQSLTLLTALAAASRPRLKRSTDSCQHMPITTSTLPDTLFLDYENPEQFYLCLSDEVLQTNLEYVLEQPVPEEFHWALKKRLQEVYPTGIPEAQLQQLGWLSRLYTAQELSQWQVTSGDTLCALLNPVDGKWDSTQRQQLITRFLELGGRLTGPLLQQIGGTGLCELSEEQIEQIPPEAIRSAGELNISTCTQSKKDEIYKIAQQAFASQAGTGEYYLQIRPYLGGAPAEDLKDLAEIGVDMDIDTFLALNPKELQELSVLDVKNLLGANLQQLKEAENQTAVICWVKKQFQEELDQILGIGLQGGMKGPHPTTPLPPAPTTSLPPVPTTSLPPVPTTSLPPVPTPMATSSHPPISTTSPKSPTPNAITPTAPHTARPSTAVTTVTSTAHPSSIAPCSTHQPATSKAPAATLLTTLLTAASPNATSLSAVPTPAVTHSATTSANVPNPTSTLVVPPAPGGAPSTAPASCNTTTPSSPCALIPKSTPAPAAITTTEVNSPPHTPTPVPNTTVSTQSISSSTAKTTTFICQTGAPPAPVSPSATASSSQATKKSAVDVPQPSDPPPGGYINLQPEAGSGSRVSSCLFHIWTTAVGLLLLQGLL